MPKNKSHHRSAIPKHQKIAGFYNCMIRADLMRGLYDRHVDEHPNVLSLPFHHPAHFGAYVLACFHMACLYEVIRAYRALKIPDATIDAILSPDLEATLLDFRDVTFHFSSPIDQRLMRMVGDRTQPVVRAHSLHDEFHSYVERCLVPFENGPLNSDPKPDA